MTSSIQSVSGQPVAVPDSATVQTVVRPGRAGTTAYLTDAGMTGAYDSIIGFRPDEALHRFLMNTPRKLEVAKRDIRLCGAMVEVDETTGRAAGIIRIREDLGE